jgi:hypothetical protein
MKGLREGFWPFDEGEWKIELEEVAPDFKSNSDDAEAIRAFRDREIAAGRWSEALDDTELLPGMKISPVFVVWQNDKPRVVTDHSRSEINDGIPRSEAMVNVFEEPAVPRGFSIVGRPLTQDADGPRGLLIYLFLAELPGEGVTSKTKESIVICVSGGMAPSASSVMTGSHIVAKC